MQKERIMSIYILTTERTFRLMKYVIVIGDGMADYKIESLGGKTPLQVAEKPRMDYMARHGIIGFVHNVPRI